MPTKNRIKNPNRFKKQMQCKLKLSSISESDGWAEWIIADHASRICVKCIQSNSLAFEKLKTWVLIRRFLFSHEQKVYGNYIYVYIYNSYRTYNLLSVLYILSFVQLCVVRIVIRPYKGAQLPQPSIYKSLKKRIYMYLYIYICEYV